MSPLEIVAILALTGFAIYQQTRVNEIKDMTAMFKMALIYVIIGLAVGGFDLPSGVAGWALLIVSLALSAGIGLLRGIRTDIWKDAEGRIFSKGNVVTIGLFVLLVACKFGMGFYAGYHDIDDGQGFGIVMIMIAIMIVFQAFIMQRRATALRAASGTTSNSQRF